MAISDRAKGSNARAVLTLKDLDDEFGSESGYRSAALRDINKRESVICKKCDLENKIPSLDLRSMHCKGCKSIIWLTADTFYHKVRLFRPRVVIMRWFEMGIIVSANQAAKLLTVSNDTVNLIYKQVGIVVSKLMLDNIVEEPSSNCVDIMDRRSIETPAREPAVAEEFEIQATMKKCLGQDANSDIKDAIQLEEDEKIALDVLSEKMSFDQISELLKMEPSDLTRILMSLELKGLIKAMPGSKFIRNDLSVSAQSKTKPENKMSIATTFMYFVKDYFQGVSRKYLQLYVSLHWLSFDRIRWETKALRKACASHPHISYEETLSYVTPPIVKFIRERRVA